MSKDGKEIPVLLSVFVMRVEQIAREETEAARKITGRQQHLLLTLTDITEQKIVEAELLKHREHLEELVTESNNGKVLPLTVATHQQDDRIEIEFADTGPGIAPAMLARIFEPLFSTKSFGVGLGLPTVRLIMEQHDGGIKVDSQPGRGTRMVLWLLNTHTLPEVRP